MIARRGGVCHNLMILHRNRNIATLFTIQLSGSVKRSLELPSAFGTEVVTCGRGVRNIDVDEPQLGPPKRVTHVLESVPYMTPVQIFDNRFNPLVLSTRELGGDNKVGIVEQSDDITV